METVMGVMGCRVFEAIFDVARLAGQRHFLKYDGERSADQPAPAVALAKL